MASFSAELRVNGHVFPVLHCSYQASQDTGSRGRAATKVRYHAVELLLNVPKGDFLIAWAANPHKQYPTDIVFRDGAGGSIIETLSMAAAYCVLYEEVFVSGDITTGAYRCNVTFSDPRGFTIHAGGPAKAFSTPAARDHGTPPMVSSIVPGAPDPGTVSTCPPDVTARLQLQVDLACKSQGLSSRCTKFDSCPVLLEKIMVAGACIAARKAIMIQCFGGGDTKHKEQIENRERGIRNCRDIYERRCGPLPEPAPEPLPVPSSEPSEKKEDNKYGPTTLTGVALLLFLILRSILNPVPN
jgi:hypothetical protein